MGGQPDMLGAKKDRNLNPDLTLQLPYHDAQPHRARPSNANSGRRPSDRSSKLHSRRAPPSPAPVASKNARSAVSGARR